MSHPLTLQWAAYYFQFHIVQYLIMLHSLIMFDPFCIILPLQSKEIDLNGIKLSTGLLRPVNTMTVCHSRSYLFIQYISLYMLLLLFSLFSEMMLFHAFSRPPFTIWCCKCCSFPTSTSLWTATVTWTAAGTPATVTLRRQKLTVWTSSPNYNYKANIL